MSFVDTIRQWDKGIAYADNKDWTAALNVFLDIRDQNSKIFFNIGSLHLNNHELDAAEKAFDKSICKDEHLAIAFFQRGITFYKKEMFEESRGDFQNAFAELRGNQLIDYNLLGLRYKLYACEVLHNMALTQAQLGQWDKAQGSLLTALNLKTESKHAYIDQALESILKHRMFDLVEIKRGTLFRPKKHYVAELENKDYMGKAKILASIVPEDKFSGFAPLQPQVEEAPVQPKTPEVLRALEGDPHSVLYEFLPETEDELGVLPGNIVFVLEKGSDNWATVFFNGKKGLVPYNYLEPVEITLSSKQGQADNLSDAIPAPPRGEAPTRPKRRRAPDSLKTSSALKTAAKAKETRKVQRCIVKIHFKYTLAITTAPGLPYSALLQKIGQKLGLPVQQIILSYKKSGSNTKVTVNESEMDSVWKSVQNDRLVLWCDLSPVECQSTGSTEETDHKPQVLATMVALHAFEGSQPEDLQLQCGDIVTILSKVNNEWFEGQCNGKVGIFPALFVEELVMEDKPI
ncbi:neutrophil cytosol factor 2 isoform X1 [Scleropages formosus]|uniref:Neutrophil cytosolic factor 2 n=1 Tax=Scleropages formosus TaxID=113540 RepID=A0A8C9RZN6_SCLFO|nr:neutrophil cytosol factor 2 isoform X1 [Scleropages formosus]